jgi:hypothetical protein
MHYRNSGIKQDHIKHHDQPEQCQTQLDSPGNGWSAFLKSSLRLILCLILHLTISSLEMGQPG